MPRWFSLSINTTSRATSRLRGRHGAINDGQNKTRNDSGWGQVRETQIDLSISAFEEARGPNKLD